MNPNIYVSCIKPFWTTIAVKKVNDVTRLQALVDKKKVVITEASIRDVLRLDDAEGIECLPNEEIFAELARMGYEKPSIKLTFYKASFSSQWKFLILTIQQCMSTKRTSWNEFSSSMASVVICLSSGKGFSRVETPLFEGMIVEQQVTEGDADEVHDEGVLAVGVVTEGVVSTADDKLERRNKLKVLKLKRLKRVRSAQRIDTLDDTVMDDVSKQGRIIRNIDANEDVVLEDAKDVVTDAKDDENANIQGRTAESQAQIYKIDLEHANKVLNMQDKEESKPTELQEAVDVVTTAKIITEVVTAASTTITAADISIPTATIAAAPTLTAAPSRRTKGVVIRDPEESTSASTIIHFESKSKDKGKGILVEEPKPLKKQAQIKQDEKYAKELEAELNRTIDWDEVINHVNKKPKEDNAVKRYQAIEKKPQTEAQARKNMMIYLKNVAGIKMDYFKGMNYDDIRPVFEKYFDSNVAFLQKIKEQMDEEDSRALKRLNESKKEKAAKKQKLEEEVEELKRHLQIVPNDNNKPYYKIKRANGSHQLYLSFLSLLRNFDREDLEALWSLVKERFATTKPKKFSDDFLLITLGAMFENPDIHAQIWKN
nr:hypothetical protein [Tanacetum cinerariifolium]